MPARRTSTAPKRPEPAPSGRRERTKAENRAAILAAARRLFIDLGYETATVRDVIGATGLAAGTFYNYFPDKESVLRALLDEKMSEMQQRSVTLRRKALTVEDTIRLTLDVSFAMLVEDRDVFELLRRNAGAIRATLDEPGYVESTDELRRDLDKALRRSGTTGVDAAYLAAAISGLAFEVATVAVDRGPAALDAARAFSEALVLGGVRALGSQQQSSRTKAASRNKRASRTTTLNSPRKDAAPRPTAKPSRSAKAGLPATGTPNARRRPTNDRNKRTNA
jgi:AcrR family transcriptional regulator